jgi:O-antigen ligase
MLLKGVTLRAVLQGTAPYLVPLILVGLSPFWSDESAVSNRRALHLILEFSFLVIVLSTYREPREIWRVLWRMSAIVTILDVAVLMVPQLSFTEIGYQGVHSHKNQAGSFALLNFPIALAALISPGIASTRTRALLLLAAILLIAVLSQSKTSTALILVSVISAAVLLALARSNARTLLMSALIAGAILTFGIIWINDFRWEDAIASMSIDPTLTGRDQVWVFTEAHIAQRPWLGFGFGSFWDAQPTSAEYLNEFGITFAFGQAHNGYLDLLVQLGCIGMASVIVMAFAILFRLFRLARAGYDSTAMAMAFMTFSVFWLHNITESTLLRPGTDMWIYLVLFTLTVVKTRPDSPYKFPTK